MTARLVRCPQCGKSVEYRSDNPARPFCSARCKLIDLGAWAEERYSIGGSAASSDESDADEAQTVQRQPDPITSRGEDS